ncbi:DMT family transporter [Paucibacter sp. R3-3]|uniref:DMT family transporter n=1 Tax=Roseateles agri TaxID=3098619 RepID=A0ABU5DL89_9BURK|nr:DMT family transporter [Paucibacter sp. R3-3]MDY0746478.1 DMT family transporter [Paucibacter sp. R3-3]
MPASALMVLASFLFATMSVCVKLAGAYYDTGEIVMYRGLTGMTMLFLLTRARGQTLRTPVPALHFWRSLSGVIALSLWFFSIGKLPLATAMTLNYMSSIWMALFLVGGAVMLGGSRIDPKLIASVLVGFAGVALVLRPTIDRDQFWHGLAGLCSGVLSATAYLQVTALGRSGEPEYRIVFYFSMGGAIAGLLTTLALKTSGQGNPHGHSITGIALLLAVGMLATVAQLMMTRAYARGKTLVNASLQYTGILFSFVYGVLLFSDPVTLWAVAGITLIVAAGLSATLLRAKTTPVDSQNHAITES